MYITSKDELESFCEHARCAKMLAVDTEFLREKSYYPKLCLVQLGTVEEIALIDPLAISDLSPLADIMIDTQIVKVFHACSQDLEVLFDVLDVVPQPVFDTQFAAAFLGMRQQISYGDLVNEACRVRLPKAQSLSDWSHRPLTAEQLEYAADDVRYLPRIYEKIMDELLAKDRLGWVLPEMQQLIDKISLTRDPREAYIHLKHSASLTRRQLAIAREACAWREEMAAQRDVPRRWVVSDEVLVECSRHLPRDINAIKRIRGAAKISTSDAEALLAALRRGAKSDGSDLPRRAHKEHSSKDSEGVIDLMNAMVRISSAECGIAPQLLATRDDLHDLLAGKCDCALLQGWRKQIIGNRLEKLLSGELGLTVKDGHIELL